MSKVLITLMILIGFTHSTAAQESACEIGTAKKQDVFENMYSGINGFSKKLCDSMIDGSGFDEQMTMYLQDWKNKLTLNLEALDALKFDKDYLVTSSTNALLSFKQPTQLKVTNVRNGPVADLQLGGKSIAKLNKVDCKKYFQKKNCKQLFDDINQAIISPFDAIQKNTLAKRISAHEFKNKAWTNYFTNSRSQTSLDIFVNTLYYRNELKKETYVGPPDKQYFFIHPSLIMHYSKNAAKGERMQEALAIEWFGVNYWNRPTPIGWSIISTYADRASVKSVSHGIMVHVNNNYSFGFTTNSDKEHGIFVTFDLLKLFEDTKSNYKSYVSSAKDYLIQSD
ncbi:hypothetical protein AB6T38_01600 [Aliiglaciecola sp. SL4]|uniref:hypothetical protein n=1 Tax=Aliiglaciecola sp. SL4 TaxID=3239806 RepID=UPI00355B58C4